MLKPPVYHWLGIQILPRYSYIKFHDPSQGQGTPEASQALFQYPCRSKEVINEQNWQLCKWSALCPVEEGEISSKSMPVWPWGRPICTSSKLRPWHWTKWHRIIIPKHLQQKCFGAQNSSYSKEMSLTLCDFSAFRKKQSKKINSSYKSTPEHVWSAEHWRKLLFWYLQGTRGNPDEPHLLSAVAYLESFTKLKGVSAYWGQREIIFFTENFDGCDFLWAIAYPTVGSHAGNDSNHC